MGAYLSEPKIEKISSDEVGKNVAYGASSMQGWRVSQEDAHNCCISFDEGVSLFAVYDGHGGAEVAEYCAKNLPDFIKNTEAYKNGQLMQALIDAFLGFDATLATPEVMKVLKELSLKDDGSAKECSEDEEENVKSLCQEAQMPLDQVMKKYSKMATAKQCAVSDGPKSSGSRQFYEKAGTSSAGCSSSSSSLSCSSLWNTNEADVSSSSQHCSSSLASPSSSKNASKPQNSECSVSSESDNALDSTTGNGDIAHESKDQIEKNEDMPDSSGDSKHCISASKNENAEIKEDKIKGENGESVEEVNTCTADSSKSMADNVSSSSSSPMENGEVSKEGPTSERRKKLINYFDKSSDDDDDDDDDENDRNFHYGETENDDDTDEVEEEESDSSGSFQGDDAEDDDDDDDDYEDLDDAEEDEILYDNFRSDEPGIGSGCTAVVAILKDNELYVANAGDSRCVLCRGGTAVELSLDHKPEDTIEMDRIVKAGGKVTADGRVNGGLNLSRAIGDHSYKRNSSLPAQDQMISAYPDVRHITIEPDKDEFMILACDGIWNFMSSQDVVGFVRERLNKSDKLSKICEELFDFCLAPNTLGDGTGCDNMTAVIVKFQHSNSNDKVEVTTGNVVAKKRPAKFEENSEVTKENDASDEQKRLKLKETV